MGIIIEPPLDSTVALETLSCGDTFVYMRDLYILFRGSSEVGVSHVSPGVAVISLRTGDAYLFDPKTCVVKVDVRCKVVAEP